MRFITTMGDDLISFVLDGEPTKSTFYHLSMNPTITMDHVRAHPDVPWDVDGLCANPNISENFVIDNLNKITGLGWLWLSQNGAISVQFMLGHPEMPWSWQNAGHNPTLRMHHVINHPDLPWHPSFVANKNINLNDILHYSKDHQLNWAYVSQNPNVTMQVVMDLADKPWNMDFLALNPSIRFQDIVCHPEKFGMYVCARKSISMDIVLQFPQIWSETYFLSKNKSIRVSEMLQTGQIQWDWTSACRNPSITIDDVHEMIDRGCKLDWHSLSENTGISISDMRANPSMPWIKADAAFRGIYTD